MVQKDKTHVQLSDNGMQYRLSEMVAGLDENFEDLDVQLSESQASNVNNHRMAAIAAQYGIWLEAARSIDQKSTNISLLHLFSW